MLSLFVVLCHNCASESEQGVALAILRGVIDFKREPWPQVSESAKSLVRQMLNPDPKKRLTAQQVLGKCRIDYCLKMMMFQAEGGKDAFSVQNCELSIKI